MLNTNMNGVINFVVQLSPVIQLIINHKVRVTLQLMKQLIHYGLRELCFVLLQLKTSGLHSQIYVHIFSVEIKCQNTIK